MGGKLCRCRKRRNSRIEEGSDQRTSLKDLTSDEDILVLRADKGMVTVVMDKMDYEAKMLRMLDEENMCHPVEKDSIPSLERVHAKLLDLKQTG